MPALRRSARRCAGLALVGLACSLVAQPAPAGAISASVQCSYGRPSVVVLDWGGPLSGNWDLSWRSLTTGAASTWSVPSSEASLTVGQIGPLAEGDRYVFTVVGKPPTESEAESSGPIATTCPGVDAGPDQAHPLRTLSGAGSNTGRFELDGSVTGVDPGTPVTFRWQKESGPGVVVFDSPDAEDTRVRFSEAGRYLLRLTATIGSQTLSDQVAVAAQPTSLLWGSVLDSAVRQYQDNRKTAARGYYQQVLNLVCAASLSPAKACKPMRPHYAVAWAQDWIHAMFHSFLIPYRATSVARKLAVQGASAGLAALVLVRFPFAIPIVQPRNIGAALAGAAHFMYDLRPGFKTQTRRHLAQVKDLLGPAATGADLEEAAAIRSGVLRCQHDTLFASAVVPGFRVVTASGGLSKLGGLFAEKLVPFAAREWREHYVEAGLRKLLGTDRGKAVFAASRARGCVL